MTSKDEIVAEPVLDTKEKDSNMKFVELNIESVVKTIESTKSRERDNRVLEKLMQQAKRRKVKESRYKPKEILLGKPGEQIKWEGLPLALKCACSTDPCTCQPHLMSSGQLPKRRISSYLPASYLKVKKWLTAGRGSAPEPAGTLVPRLTNAVKAEIETCKEREKNGQRSSSGPEFCGSTCIAFRKQTDRNFAEKKQLLEKYLKDNAEEIKHDSQPEVIFKQSAVLEEVVPRVLSDLPMKEIEEECCKENDFVAMEEEKVEPDPLQLSDGVKDVEDTCCDDENLNKQGVEFVKLDDLVTSDDGNLLKDDDNLSRDDGNLSKDDGLKIQDMKVETDSCPCSVYEIERSDDNNLTDVDSATNQTEDKIPISFVIKRRSCKNKCHCPKSKMESSKDPEDANKNESDNANHLKEVKEKESMQSIKTRGIIQEQLSADMVEANIFKDSSAIVETNAENNVKSDSAHASNLSAKSSTQSKKKLKWGNDAIEIREKKDDIKVLGSYGLQNNEEAGSIILQSLEHVNAPVVSNEVLDEGETDSDTNACITENLEKDNKTLELSESVNEIEIILNDTAKHSFTDNASVVIGDDEFTNKGEKNITQTTDFNVQIPMKLKGWTRNWKENPIIQDTKDFLNNDSKSDEESPVDELKSSEISLKKSKSCDCTLREFLKRLKFREFFNLTGQNSCKKELTDLSNKTAV